MSRNKCGFCGIYPRWLQNWATSRSFIVVYGLLGTVQAMAFIYIVVSLTTLEKRFKIPSRTTGIILSGNEISQILSVLLIYYGGSGHRPRWIAIGVACSALSCLVLALPHFIYGPGQDALALTREYLNGTLANSTSKAPTCSVDPQPEKCNENTMLDTSLAPRLMVFFSQFILGIGTTLYYGLGQTYMDDNTKKKNTPMLLGLTFSLRTVGPAFGFILGYLCLNIYIAPNLHPLIDRKDPRWLGAWWLGWILLGITMLIFAGLLSMFPHELRKSKKSSQKPKTLPESEVPLKIEAKKVENHQSAKTSVVQQEKPSLKDFPKTVKRILRNKVLMFNIFSGVFYILSASPFMNFIAKYLEVQFQTSPGGGTIIIGPLTLLGMILGFVVSGSVIGKFKPSARPLLFWNVVVGFCYIFGLVAFMFLGCSSGNIQGVDFDTMKTNLTTACNAACNCENIKYSPVCHEPTKTTFFSACHAGCQSANDNSTIFGNCSCVFSLDSVILKRSTQGDSWNDMVTSRSDKLLGSLYPTVSSDFVELDQLNDTVTSRPEKLLEFLYSTVSPDSVKLDQLSDTVTSHPGKLLDSLYSTVSSDSVKRDQPYDSVTSGPCKQDCFKPYVLFSIVSTLINILGCSGRIGNVLINFRCVETRDKSLAQGIALMIISLFALIPGPIIFGAIMDSTCVIWEVSCKNKGNCWIYHKDNFRYYVNLTAACMCSLAVIFDGIVCYLSKGIDLYGDTDENEKAKIPQQKEAATHVNNRQISCPKLS